MTGSASSNRDEPPEGYAIFYVPLYRLFELERGAPSTYSSRDAQQTQGRVAKESAMRIAACGAFVLLLSAFHPTVTFAQWSGWGSLGGVLTSNPDCVSREPNRIDCFARGTDNAIWHKWWDRSSWSGWESLGGELTSGPTAASWGANRLDVFARGTDNALWHKWWDGRGWRGWERVGGVLKSDPDCVSREPNRIDCFVRGVDDALWRTRWDGRRWRGWQSLGGELTSGPTASSRGANRLDVFVRGPDDALWRKRWDGRRWRDWQNLGGVLASDPDCVSGGPDRIDCFIRGTDSALWHKWWDGSSWLGWESLGGVLTSGPTAAAWSADRLDGFVLGNGNALYHKWFDVFHTQSVGNRGTDVKAIQWLLLHHLGGPSLVAGGLAKDCLLAVNGRFDTPTDDCVKRFQSESGLPSDGVVDERTWERLTSMELSRGASGDAVKAVQTLLMEKHEDLGDEEFGTYGFLTEASVDQFQWHMGLSQTGRVDSTTWRNLVWHYEPPNEELPGLCMGGGNPLDQSWGTAAIIGQLEAAAVSFFATGNGPLALRDVSLEHGFTFLPHGSHQVGLDADIWPVSKDSDQCDVRVRWDDADYDRDGTRQLIQAINATATKGHVRKIFFNDPVLIGEGLTLGPLDGHDDHLHVRYCEEEHPRGASYACQEVVR